MPLEIIPILALLLVVLGVVGAIYLLTYLLGPRRPGDVKLSPYESGKEPIGDARIRFPIRFYLIAMLFVLFDIELVFFYPWAVVYRKLLSAGSFILIEMVIFIALLLIGYVYAWKRGALQWD
ncbi:MAG TPA: NADH-quinone oxidoreductase subunit A [bacterium]|nr:NADH-quinone oxidoreductase subunit A [bacterium]